MHSPIDDSVRPGAQVSEAPFGETRMPPNGLGKMPDRPQRAPNAAFTRNDADKLGVTAPDRDPEQLVRILVTGRGMGLHTEVLVA